MFWAIPVMGVALALLAALGRAAGAERERFQRTRQQVLRDVSWHRRRLEEHLGRANSTVSFRLLAELHYSSVQVADKAHGLLDSARHALRAIDRALDQAAADQASLSQALRNCRSKKRRADLRAELASIRKLRRALGADRSRLRSERDELLEQVRQHNLRTRELKEAIRDRCGHRGRMWYHRLDERTRRRARRKAP